MPVLLRVGPFVFLFWASDRDEAPHVHVRAGRRKAKFWLEPAVRLARNQGFRAHELTVIRALVVEYREFFLEKWHEFFDR
jgi:hypothetical protein